MSWTEIIYGLVLGWAIESNRQLKNRIELLEQRREETVSKE